MRAGGSAVLWSALEAGAGGLLSFVSAFLVARLVGPAELGIGAAALAPQILLWIAVNALFADALTQRATPDAETEASAFWASLAVGVAAAALMAALGTPLARGMDDTRLPAMAAVLALPLPLVGAAGAAQGVLTRGRRYRALAARTVLGQGLGAALGVALALMGSGAWAVVAQQAAGQAIGAAVLLARAGGLWRYRPSLARVRELLGVGAPLVAATLVQHGRYRLFALAIGDVAGAAALGEVHLAFRLVDTLRDLTATALWRLMLPTFAERRADRHAFCGALDRCLALSGLVMFPLWGALALTAGPLVALLLGPQWSAVGAAALPLIALAAWMSLTFPLGVAAVAHGATGYTLAANLATLALTQAGAMLLRPDTPAAAAWIWTAAQVAVAPFVLTRGARAVRLAPGRSLRAGLPALALGGAAAAGAAILDAVIVAALPDTFDAPLGRLVLRLVLLGGLYVPAAALLLRGDGRKALEAAGLARSPARTAAIRSWYPR